MGTNCHSGQPICTAAGNDAYSGTGCCCILSWVCTLSIAALRQSRGSPTAPWLSCPEIISHTLHHLVSYSMSLQHQLPSVSRSCTLQCFVTNATASWCNHMFHSGTSTFSSTLQAPVRRLTSSSYVHMPHHGRQHSRCPSWCALTRVPVQVCPSEPCIQCIQQH